MQGRDRPQAEPLADVDQHSLQHEQTQQGEREPLRASVHLTDEGGPDHEHAQHDERVRERRVELEHLGADEDVHAGEEDLQADGGEVCPRDDREDTGAGEGANHESGDLQAGDPARCGAHGLMVGGSWPSRTGPAG